ncbi:hypothetical protein ACFYKX_14335 [Cytobacillus sp. FJAT-54145]|uniref:Uncharacterized protein n=1 Tax=Cytobacillus spartinae TaxID=3299023 RepID=A0ABW6KC16_9BACI
MKKIIILLFSILMLMGNANVIAFADEVDLPFTPQKVMWDGEELKIGQIGRLIIVKDTPLFKLEEDQKVFVRTLKASEKYRIYAFKPGMLSVGGGLYVNRDSKIKYETPSKAKLEAVQKAKLDIVRVNQAKSQSEKPTNPYFLSPELAITTQNTASSIRIDDYYYGDYFSTSGRYLFKDFNNGNINLLYTTDKHLHVDKYNQVFSRIGSNKIEMELPIFGGFHSGEDGNYYVIYGQENLEESNTKSVYRIVKYNSSWKKLASVDIKDVYVTRPFYASNLTMDSYNGKLVIHSARLRYRSNDGLNHQSNISFLVDTKDMIVLDKGGQWPKNHVSHSFATYVRFDGDKIIYADHGDAYPRSIVLQVEQGGMVTREVELIKFAGEIGDNYTGAQLGGLEVGLLNYLMVGSYKDNKNVYLGLVSKETDLNSKVIPLTNHSLNLNINIIETHISKMNNDKFVVMWNELNTDTYENNLYYLIVNSNGDILQKMKKLPGIPSPGNMNPLVQGDTLIWYNTWSYYIMNRDYTERNVMEFFTLHN